MEQLEIDLYTSAERRAWLDGYHAALDTVTPFAALCAYAVMGALSGFLFGFFIARWLYV